MLKARLDRAWSNLVWRKVSLPMEWNGMRLKALPMRTILRFHDLWAGCEEQSRSVMNYALSEAITDQQSASRQPEEPDVKPVQMGSFNTAECVGKS
ncbi:hypothetical protein DUI87_24073 [Hirundo rustica rustica]|uniref:Uncharacterized protein n=1 Tax=Hirundo rustica rustica TaxID=333673 RepID=A0A3M0JES8_HIRRU|nr:hypothetical protein DUI87_24073 [Hirundo rustica rustica]